MQTVRVFVMPDGDTINVEIEMSSPKPGFSIRLLQQERQGNQCFLKVEAVHQTHAAKSPFVATRELRHTIPDADTSITHVVVSGTDAWGNRITPIRVAV